MFKKDLRLNYGQLREKLAEEALQNFSIQIANQALNLQIWSLDYYHLFLPISTKKEVDTSPILSILQGKDKNVIVPKVVGKTMEHYLLTDNTKFIESKWGVPEPDDGIAVTEEKIDVVFIPLLAFDEKGNRVGYGKGFYDGFLKKCRKDIVKIGLSFFKPEKIILDIEPHDIRLDYCITPEKIYSFSAD